MGNPLYYAKVLFSQLYHGIAGKTKQKVINSKKEFDLIAEKC
jgi:hypothetical protein